MTSTTTGMAAINASGLANQTRHVQPGAFGEFESGAEVKQRSDSITANARNRQDGCRGSQGFPEIVSTFPPATTSLCVMNELILMPATGRISTLLATCGLTLAMAATGCSTFNSDWKRASATPAPAIDIDGRWEGSWLSESNGHHGRLRCLVSRLDHRSYRARFKATYWKFFRFSYTANLQVTRESPGPCNFQGEADLGWWGGGVYHYDGQATPKNFFSTYRSKYDHGTFRMARPETSAP